MKNVITCCLFLWCAAGLASPHEYLVKIDAVNANDSEILELIDDDAIIIAGDNDRVRLEKSGVEYSVLDDDPRDKFYVFVFPAGEDIRKIKRFGTVIALFNECVLLRTTPEFIPELNKLKVELSILKYRPIMTSRRFYKDQGNLSLAPDTLIEQMIAAVDPDTILAAVLHMQHLYTRYSTSDSNRIALVDWICDKLLAYSCDSIYTHAFSTSYGHNVIGVEKGKLYPGTGRYCLIGAHIDDIPSSGYAPGADDNASGMAAVLEAARIMRNFNFENTVRFAGFNAEEQGLIGSDSLAAFAQSQGDTILAATCYDMIGYATEPDSAIMRLRYTTAVPGCSLFASVYYQAVADTYTQLKIRPVRYTGTSGSSDHASFWKHGYISTGGIERVLCPGYHTIGDSVGPVGFNDLAFAVQVIKTAIAVLAKLAVPMHEGVAVNEMTVKNTFHPITVYPSIGNSFSIYFEIRQKEDIEISVYDITGSRVVQIIDGTYNKGMFRVKWEGSDQAGNGLSPGVYFVSFKANSVEHYRKIVVL